MNTDNKEEATINKKSVQWLMDKVEQRHSRYIEAENCIMEVLELPLWKFILFGKKHLLRHIKNSLEKYNF